MAYSSDFLKDTVTILNRTASKSTQFGREGGDFAEGKTIHANVKWTKGVKALREGAIDAYDYIMVRCRWNSTLKRESRIKWNGRVFQIDSFFEDYQENEMQATCVEIK